MPIVSWTIEEGAIQINGRLSIVERYQHDDGRESMFQNVVDAGLDLDAYAAARAAELDEWEANPPETTRASAKVLKDAVALIAGGQSRFAAKVLIEEALVLLDDEIARG